MNVVYVILLATLLQGCSIFSVHTSNVVLVKDNIISANIACSAPPFIIPPLAPPDIPLEEGYHKQPPSELGKEWQ